MRRCLHKSCVLALCLLSGMVTGQQVANDECQFATFIADVDEYCSPPLTLTNEGATPSPQGRPSCWPDGTVTNDVWYSFIPKNLGVVITLTGQGVTNEGTLDAPSVALYSGDCNGLVEEVCGSILFNENVLELTQTDLTIGAIYYLRIDGRDNNVGSFKLCINTFSPVPSPESDCIDGVVLCNKDAFFVEKIEGVGDDTNEVNNTCIQQELASVWYKWTCDQPGSLTFTITPNNPIDDIDFAVYELSGGLDGCGSKRPIRCMASGETIGNSQDLNSPCFGPTGLSLNSNDTQENPGCSPGDDNFVAAIDMEAGVSYALIINNFSQSGSGFSISWGGTGTFLGPDASFITEAQDAFECDKTIFFYNTSTSQTDPIVSHAWSFGNGADPATASNVDTTAVIYDSFGNKTAAIIVETSRGCIVTEVVDFFVEPCCRDTSTLDVQAEALDLLCADSEDGLITAEGISGSPAYQFSLDGENFQPNPRFSELTAGTFLVYIVDKKGCVDSVLVDINAPPPIIVDAGPDQEVDLGETTFLDGNFISTFMSNSVWEGFGFIDSNGVFILNPEILPPGETTYTLTVTDEFGCTESDQVTIRVRIVRPVSAPNVISNFASLDINKRFNLFGGPAVDRVDELLVYDRWGNLVYKGDDLPINDTSRGWDGTLNGEEVAPGVYAWKANVLFIDGVSLPYSGDVTVVR